LLLHILRFIPESPPGAANQQDRFVKLTAAQLASSNGMSYCYWAFYEARNENYLKKMFLRSFLQIGLSVNESVVEYRSY